MPLCSPGLARCEKCRIVAGGRLHAANTHLHSVRETGGSFFEAATFRTVRHGDAESCVVASDDGSEVI